jgi:hypothetical protein
MNKIEIDKTQPLQIKFFKDEKVVNGKKEICDNFIVTCKCGNEDQDKFTNFQAIELADNPDRPWQKKSIKVNSLRCNECREHRSLFALQLEMGQMKKDQQELLDQNREGTAKTTLPEPQSPKKTLKQTKNAKLKGATNQQDK